MLGFDAGVEVRSIKDRIGVCLQSTNLQDKIMVHEALELFASLSDLRTLRIEDLQAVYKRFSVLGKPRVVHKLSAMLDFSYEVIAFGPD